MGGDAFGEVEEGVVFGFGQTAVDGQEEFDGLGVAGDGGGGEGAVEEFGLLQEFVGVADGEGLAGGVGGEAVGGGLGGGDGGGGGEVEAGFGFGAWVGRGLGSGGEDEGGGDEGCGAGHGVVRGGVEAV